MKKITLTSVLLLLCLGASASAAERHSSDQEVVVLPAYPVSAPRLTPLEKSIASGLTEFREQAGRIAPVSPELPALGSAAKRAQPNQGRAIAGKPLRPAAARS